MNYHDKRALKYLGIDLIEGLKGGLLHHHVCGNAKERKTEFTKNFKEHCDKGEIIHDIRSAPRNARYKIDWYFSSEGSTEDSIKYEYINSFFNVIKYLKLTNDFNPNILLKKCRGEYTVDRITIGYGEIDSIDWENKPCKEDGYYIKIDDKISTLMFSNNPTLVDYNDKFWSKYKDIEQCSKTFHDLMYEVSYHMTYLNIK